MVLTAKEFDAIVRKLGMETRNTDHLHAWFEVDGTVAVRTRRSHGRGELAAGDKIRQQLKVNETQMRSLIDCSMSRDAYVLHLRARGVI